MQTYLRKKVHMCTFAGKCGPIWLHYICPQFCKSLLFYLFKPLYIIFFNPWNQWITINCFYDDFGHLGCIGRSIKELGFMRILTFLIEALIL